MTATDIAAWVGSATGVASLGWNIHVKVTTGPRLRVSAYAGMVMRPAPPGDPKFLNITVQNIGSQPTTITNVSFHTYSSRWARRKRNATQSFVLGHYEGSPMGARLDIGGEWRARMQQGERFSELLRTHEMWCAVHHSFSQKPTEVKIINPVQHS
jgi:hypothetical protein